MVRVVAAPNLFQRTLARFSRKEAGSEVARPVPVELGITGTANFSGDILAESNLKLIHEQAYGRAGSRDWGFWEYALRTDEAVAKSLDFVVAPIRDALLEVEEAKDNPNGKAQADFVRWVLDNIEPGAPEFLAQTTRGSLGIGFSLHELVPDFVSHKSLPGGQGVAFVKLAERLPNSIHPNGWIEEDGQLVAVKQNGPLGTHWKSVDLPVERLLLNSWNRTGNNYLGFSAFRPTYYQIKTREQLAKLIAISHMRESAGIPIAFAMSKDSQKLSQGEKESLQRFLSNSLYHENAALVLPLGYDIKWLFAPSTNKSVVLEAFNQLGLLIMQQVGAQQLYLGTSDTGSRSVGEVHSAQARSFLGGVVANLEAVLNGVTGRPYTGFVRKLIDLNWGPQSSYPKIKLVLRKPELDIKSRLEAIKLARDAGLLTANSLDENAVREELGLPLEDSGAAVDENEQGADESTAAEPANLPAKEPDQPAAGVAAPAVAGAVIEAKAQDTALNGAQSAEARELLKAAATRELPFETVERLLVVTLRITQDEAVALVAPIRNTEPLKIAPPPPPFGAPPAPDKEEPEEEAAPKVEMAAAPKPWAPYRPLRASEQVVNFAAMDAFLNAGREDFENGVRPILTAELVRLLPEVKDAMKDGDPSEVSGLSMDLAPLEAFIGAFLEKNRAEGWRTVASEKRRGTSALVESRAEGAAGLTPPPVQFAEEEEDDRRQQPDLEEPTERTQHLLDVQKKTLARRMASRLKADIETEAIEVARTRGEPTEVVGRVVQRQLEGGGLKNDASSVMTKAFNMGREEFARSRADEIEAVELSAQLDGNQCAPCDALDGSTFDFESDEHDRNTPPLRACDGGTRCRCILIYRFRRGDE